jgi:hypothetical protein
LAGQLLPRQLTVRALERDLELQAVQSAATRDSLRVESARAFDAWVASERRGDSLVAIVARLCNVLTGDTLLSALSRPECTDSATALMAARIARERSADLLIQLTYVRSRQERPDTARARLALQPEARLAAQQLVQMRERNVTTVDSLAERFHSTARWHPLAGDWLLGFGAFLGRPLREYDFYVGMYDGFVLVTENVDCGNLHRLAAKIATDSAITQFKECVAKRLAGLIRNPPLQVGAVGPRMLRALYRDEFQRDVDSMPLAPPQGATISVADSAWIVVDAVRRAMYVARMAQPRTERKGSTEENESRVASGHCRKPGIVGAAFCDNGLVAFLDELATERRAVEILDRWSDVAACRGSDAWEHPDGCRAERRFVSMIHDPEGALNSLTREALGRLETITPRGGAPRRMASALLFLHGSTSDRHRRGWDFGPTSLPLNLNRAQRTVFYLLPSSVTLTPNIAAWGEYGWELRRHLGAGPFAIAAPLHVRPFSEIGADSTGLRTLVIPGVRLELKALPLNSRIGFELDKWLRPHDGLREMDRGVTRGVFASIGGKINFSWTGVPKGLPLFRQSARIRPAHTPTVVSAGVGDVNGMMYWFWRLVRG